MIIFSKEHFMQPFSATLAGVRIEPTMISSPRRRSRGLHNTDPPCHPIQYLWLDEVRNVISISTEKWINYNACLGVVNSQFLYRPDILNNRCIKICSEFQETNFSNRISHWQPNSVYLFTNKRKGMFITLTSLQSTLILRDTFVDLESVSKFHMTFWKISNSRDWMLKR